MDEQSRILWRGWMCLSLNKYLAQLKDSKYYNDYKILEEIGYDKLIIKKVYTYLKPKFIKDSIKYMSTINDIYQHEFFPDEININKCYFVEKK